MWTLNDKVDIERQERMTTRDISVALALAAVLTGEMGEGWTFETRAREGGKGKEKEKKERRREGRKQRDGKGEEDVLKRKKSRSKSHGHKERPRKDKTELEKSTPEPGELHDGKHPDITSGQAHLDINRQLTDPASSPGPALTERLPSTNNRIPPRLDAKSPSSKNTSSPSPSKTNPTRARAHTDTSPTDHKTTHQSSSRPPLTRQRSSSTPTSSQPTVLTKKPPSGLTTPTLLETLAKLLSRQHPSCPRVALSLSISRRIVRLHLSHSDSINRNCGRFLHQVWNALRGIANECLKFRAGCGGKVKCRPGELLDLGHCREEEFRGAFVRLRREVGGWCAPRVIVWLKEKRGELERFVEFFEKTVYAEGNKELEDFKKGLELLGKLHAYTSTPTTWKESSTPPAYEPIMALFLELTPLLKPTLRRRSQITTWETQCFKTTPTTTLNLVPNLDQILFSTRTLQVLSALAQTRPLSALRNHKFEVYDLLGRPQQLCLPPTPAAWDIALLDLENAGCFELVKPGRGEVAGRLFERFEGRGGKGVRPCPEATLLAYHHALTLLPSPVAWSTYPILATSSKPCKPCKIHLDSHNSVFGSNFQFLEGKPTEYIMPWVMPGMGGEGGERLRADVWKFTVARVRRLGRRCTERVVKRLEEGKGREVERGVTSEEVTSGGSE